MSIWDKKQIKKEKDESVNNDINSLVPKSLVINGISYLNNFTLSWNNNNDSEKIMIHILNLSDPSNKIDIAPASSNNLASLNILIRSCLPLP